MDSDIERLLDHYGTAAAPHAGGRALRDHLVGTYALLKEWQNPEEICLAGLFHSIYGTEVYTLQSASLEQRDVVRSAIGGVAEELAYLFCACDRSRLLAGPGEARVCTVHDRFEGREVKVDVATFAGLVEIAFANALEQLPHNEAVVVDHRWGSLWEGCRPYLSSAARSALEHTLGKTRWAL